MRVYLVAVLVVLAVYVSGQPHPHPCDHHGMCHTHGNEHCGGHDHVACHDGMCTCTGGPNGQNCTQMSDCTTCSQDQHHDHPAHCVDNVCHCGPPPPQGGHAGP